MSELPSKRKSGPEPSEDAAKQFRITREYIADVFGRLRAVPPLDTPAVVRTSDAEVARIFNTVTGEKRTWQSCGKRAVHQPQLESLGRLIVSTFPQIAAGSPETLVVELGAGKGLLGRVIHELSDKKVPVVALDKRTIMNGFDISTAEKEVPVSRDEMKPATGLLLRRTTTMTMQF
eukprot:270500-Prorocentrum_minimum.AAC.6